MRAAALDGKLDFQETHQSGGAGSLAYSTYTRRDVGLVSQSVPLGRRMRLKTWFRAIREISGGGTEGSQGDLETRTYQPGFTFGCTTRWIYFGADGSLYRREPVGASTLLPEIDRNQYNAWISLLGTRSTRLKAHWRATASQVTGAANGYQENRERTGTVEAFQVIPRIGQVRYTFSALTSEAITRRIKRTHLSQGAEFRADTRLAGDHIDASLRARSQLFEQRTGSRIAADDPLYALPHTASVILDDTPETLDPLEGDPVAVPELYDRDRNSPTSINLGDSAPMVREYGGDYRNIQYDFGDSLTIDSAVLYIDQRLLHPELYRWRVFLSNDPEGRIWNEVRSDTVTVAYREWDTGLQGWEVAFRARASARYFKLVDVKIGPTVPDLFVTELEVFTHTTTAPLETNRQTESHKVEASLGINITPGLGIRHSTIFRQKGPRDGGPDLIERTHALSSFWQVGGIVLSGLYETHILHTTTHRDGEFWTCQVSAAHGQAGPFSQALSWSRSRDRSSAAHRTTRTLAFVLAWAPAPALRIEQSISHGQRTDLDAIRRSSSLVVTTTLRSQPIASLSLDVDRADRWVDQAAGSGFTRYNETGITVSWSPTALINLASNVRYQQRETADWTASHFVTWTPLPGGSVDVQITGNGFRDTRSDISQRGTGIGVIWRARPGLVIEGKLGLDHYRSQAQGRTPANSQVRVSWTF
jgi:hypothetical protein